MRPTSTAVLLAAVLVTTAGCEGSDDPASTPTPTATASTSTPAPTETDDETPSADPATGPVLDMPHSSARAPEGWKPSDQLVSTIATAVDNDTSSLVSLGEIESFADHALSPAELVDNWYATNPYPLKPEELPVTDLDGVEVYHLAGKEDRFTWLEEFGAVVDGRIVTLTFEMSDELSRQEQQQVVDSVVASFRWK